MGFVIRSTIVFNYCVNDCNFRTSKHLLSNFAPNIKIMLQNQKIITSGFPVTYTC